MSSTIKSRYPGPPVNPPPNHNHRNYWYGYQVGGPIALWAADSADRLPIVNNVSKPLRPIVAYGPLTKEQVSYLWGVGAGIDDDDWDNSCYHFSLWRKVPMKSVAE